ncbi:MAG: phosphate ABC transporter ATP-binding protein [Gammaproteobacteria bacterium]|nr:phosphate ABC transporter ATP-binding protein [Gammaproteobacteria bacterium]
MKTLQLRDVSAYYGDFRAIADVDLTLQPGVITALIGPSGCGKSTLLRSLNRMHEFVPGARIEGEITLDREDLYGPSVSPAEVRRVIGMVFQRPNPFPTLSIFDNVAAGLRLDGGYTRDEFDDRVEWALRSAHLWKEVEHKLHAPGASLSGGQQQRLCIARTIAVQPAVILMDEPCSALDPIATLRIEDLMRELKEDYTIVIVTHNMEQAARVSDFTGFLVIEKAADPGRLIEFGETSQIFTTPADERTERYISGKFG